MIGNNGSSAASILVERSMTLSIRVIGRRIPLLATCLIGVVAALASHGQSPPSTPPAAEKPAYTDKQVESWTHQARAAVARSGVTGEEAKKIIELSVGSRKRLAETVAQLRHDWLEMTEERLREIRQGGGSGAGLFDRSDLQRSINLAAERERRKLADELVKIIERDKARAIFPSLAAMDAKVDGLVSLLISFELPEPVLDGSIEAVQSWHIRTMAARAMPSENRVFATEEIRQAREAMLEKARGLLSEEQFRKFSAAVTSAKPVDE